ncbi:hypothetical protein M758_3G231900 [Ceratodon purpureus]|nr:hypothetical protein M758_3G231900 [Ceratodon purpureus]
MECGFNINLQVVANLQRAEKAEAANVVVRRELAQCKQGLTRVQEELKCCSADRAMLQEKNQAMAKDLAAHKLVGDTDLGEEDIFRLANLGTGSNKNAIIETLTKSLILRNKSYKELMARCNELGMGESRALRKSEKTIEHLKKMKARVQELEKLVEEKDNACLRGLNRGNSKSQNEDVLSAQRPFNQVGAKRINAPRTPPSNQSVSGSTVSRGWDIASPQETVPDHMFKLPGFREDLDVMPRAELSEVQLPKIVRERGLMGVEHVQPACPMNVNMTEEIPCPRKRGRSEEVTGLDHSEDNIASRTDFSNWSIKSKHLLQKIELLNRSKRRIDQEVIREHPRLVPSSIIQVSLPRPGPTSRLIESRSSAVASSATCKDHPVLYPSRVEHETGTQRCPVIPENSGHVNSSAVPPVNSYGAFAKRASSDRLSTSSSTFIVSGADGRGGRVTVLKPPSLSLGGVAMPAPQKMKRPKTSGAGFRGTQGSLQIEHFFGRAKS